MLQTKRNWRSDDGGLSSPSARARPLAQRSRLAVLVSPADVVSPSSVSSLTHFARSALARGLDAVTVGAQALNDLTSFDALFIRTTTSVGGEAHRFALRAAKLGLPVIDDPISIVRGSNKVLQHSLLSARDVAMPRTAIVSSRVQIPAIAELLGLPVVFKIADGCFCRGVEKAETMAKCNEVASRLLATGGPILAQEFVPTNFDWRIGVLGGQILFACKYHMVHGHWQVVARGSRGSLVNGPVEAVRLDRVPDDVVQLALRAACCIGDGFYGVDVKATAAGPIVIEVNDNPDMDIDAETIANPESWDRLADWFVAAVASARAKQGEACFA